MMLEKAFKDINQQIEMINDKTQEKMNFYDGEFEALKKEIEIYQKEIEELE